MSFLAVNLILAFVWAALVGLGIGNLMLGFVIGFLVLVAGRPFVGSGSYVRSGLALAALVVVFLYELLRANLRLARDVLRRRPHFDPALLRIDVPELGPTGAALLGALVSLTPGSITVDVDQEQRALFVHTVYAHDLNEARRSVLILAELIDRIGSNPPPAKPGGPS